VQIRDSISEEDLNSEVELLKSEDLLRKVVLAHGMQDKMRSFSPSAFFLPKVDPQERKIARAVRVLQTHLTVEPSKKSNVIVVGYSSRDARMAHNILVTLADLYQQKHMEVHHQAGQTGFFEQQADEQRKQLEEAEANLAAFPRQEGGAVAGSLERDITVQKTGDLKISLQQTQSGIQETQKRIANLNQQLATTPPRIVTTLKQSDNAQLMQQLKGTLLNLELRRTELLQKYQPTYRPVVEVEQEIAKTKVAIEAAETAPLRDTTTDLDTTHQWVRGELAKAQAELSALHARETTLRQAITEYEAKAAQLNDSSIAQADLQRQVKMLEESYQLYHSKAEEARISDALDRSRFLNVSVADAPTTPALPQHSPFAYLLGSLLAAMLVSTGTVLIAEYTNRSFRTPEEVQRWLQVPLVAALPAGEQPDDKHMSGAA